MYRIFFLLFALSCQLLQSSEMSLLFSRDEIQNKVKEVAESLDYEFQGSELTVVMLQKSGIFITSDLTRELKVKNQIEYVDPKCPKTLEKLNVQGKNVLVVDALFETGMTLSKAVEVIAAKKPLSLQTLVVVSKNHPRSVNFIPNYTLFQVEDIKLTGYGIDSTLPQIYQVK